MAAVPARALSYPRDDEGMRGEVATLRQAHDLLRHRNEAKRERISVLRDHLDRIEHQKKVAQQDVPHADEMQELLVRVSEMEHKLEATEESRQMYLQMIARLEGESTYFNRNLSKVKAAADAKEQDEAELQLMLTDATHARDDAQQICVEIQHADHAERRKRAKELARREKLLEKRREQCAEHEVDCARRRHELMVAQEQARASVERPVKNPSTVEEELAQITFYEEEFKQIQNVVGASEVQDIISKSLRQEDTYNMLNMMTKDSHKRIGATMESKAGAAAAVEGFRYEGLGEAEPEQPARYSALVSFGDQGVVAPPAWSSQHDSRLRRTARTLIDVRAGLQHLVDLVASNQTLDVEEFAAGLDTDEKLVEGLEYVTRNISQLLQMTSDSAYDARPLAREPEMRVEANPPPPREDVFLLTSKLDNFRLADLHESLADDDDDDDDPENEHAGAKSTVLSSSDIKQQGAKLVLRHNKPRKRAGKEPVAPAAAVATVAAADAADQE
ncbi:hypothetical protein T492DRAFT_1093226 [Pavlovales sp. CCMP2436]|nr:hypothetical protein T492DRAFT_1093226 [Pavlovales sp. CCMP2436]